DLLEANRIIFLDGLRADWPGDHRRFRTDHADYVLIKRSDPASIKAGLDDAVARAQRHLRIELQPTVDCFGPKDIDRLRIG
ncbi:MAG: hypothetical protein AAGF19_03665, partial [Pseudomonadota bacterium]